MRIKINSTTGYLKKIDEKYLILNSTKEYESAWSEIRSEIKRNINLVLQANNKLYPKIYLNECFYEL